MSDSTTTESNEIQNEDAAQQADPQPATASDEETAEPAAEEALTEEAASAESNEPEAVPEEDSAPPAEETVAQSTAEEPTALAQAESAPEETPTSDETTSVEEEAIAEEAKVEDATAEEAPAEAAEAEEAAAEEAKAEDAPAEEAKAEEVTTEEAKAEDTPVEEAKAEEVTTEEAKAEDAPAEEAKAEEARAKKPAPPMDPQHEAELAELRAALEAQISVDGKVIGWNKGGYHVALGRVAAFCPVSMIEIGNPRNPKNYVDKTFPFRVIEVQEDGKRIVVSRAAAIKADRAAQAAKIKELLSPGKVMKGRVSSITEFGAFVDLGGRIEGLVHISELSRKRVDRADEVVKKGQEVEVQVLKVEKGGKRISLSMKRLEDDPWESVAERFEKGQEFKGIVVRKAEFGVFVEVEPGLEGLIHVSRLPYGKSLESDEVSEGLEVEGWVHEVDRKRRRLSLSMRPVAEGNPWQGITDRYPEGELVTGTVERVADFGAFIELEPGLTGLLPFSMLGGVGNPKRQYHAGKEVSVKVLAIDTGRKRISLGTEQSTAEGSNVDYKEYKKQQREAPSGLNAMAAALAKIKDQIPTA
ncbi:MAG: S1 RNA-binding domain-containing protein [Thermoanaerobaculia bacterium]|nr:S1 RNA-binding domain-containing protein [Thermoanaerobaculia bacterium]